MIPRLAPSAPSRQNRQAPWGKSSTKPKALASTKGEAVAEPPPAPEPCLPFPTFPSAKWPLWESWRRGLLQGAVDPRKERHQLAQAEGLRRPTPLNLPESLHLTRSASCHSKASKAQRALSSHRSAWLPSRLLPRDAARKQGLLLAGEGEEKPPKPQGEAAPAPRPPRSLYLGKGSAGPPSRGGPLNLPPIHPSAPRPSIIKNNRCARPCRGAAQLSTPS